MERTRKGREGKGRQRNGGPGKGREKLANYPRDLGEYRVLKRAARNIFPRCSKGTELPSYNFNENPSTLSKNIRSRATVTAV